MSAPFILSRMFVALTWHVWCIWCITWLFRVISWLYHGLCGGHRYFLPASFSWINFWPQTLPVRSLYGLYAILHVKCARKKQRKCSPRQKRYFRFLWHLSERIPPTAFKKQARRFSCHMTKEINCKKKYFQATFNYFNGKYEKSVV